MLSNIFNLHDNMKIEMINSINIEFKSTAKDAI